MTGYEFLSIMVAAVAGVTSMLLYLENRRMASATERASEAAGRSAGESEQSAQAATEAVAIAKKQLDLAASSLRPFIRPVIGANRIEPERVRLQVHLENTGGGAAHNCSAWIEANGDRLAVPKSFATVPARDNSREIWLEGPVDPQGLTLS